MEINSHTRQHEIEKSEFRMLRPRSSQVITLLLWPYYILLGYKHHNKLSRIFFLDLFLSWYQHPDKPMVTHTYTRNCSGIYCLPIAKSSVTTVPSPYVFLISIVTLIASKSESSPFSISSLALNASRVKTNSWTIRTRTFAHTPWSVFGCNM